ncbi:MAG TPA: MFS transporter [Acidimicrobiales bacterium]|jgi:ABC-type branched-subunit amino acid transport system ATPase component/MFS family permease|nr:MFS transporter [Acidimicrobiales bacterium]
MDTTARGPLARITNGAPALPLLVLFGFNAVDELDRQAFSVLLPEIKDHFNLSLTGVTTLLAIITPMSLLLSPFVGHLADRARRVRMARTGAALWSVFSFLTALVPNVFLLGVARAGSSIAKIVNDPTHNSLLPDYYDVDTRVKVFSAHRAANNLGRFVAPLLAGGLIVSILGLSWRVPFLIFAIPTALLVLVSFRLKEPVRGRFERRAAGGDAEAEEIEEQAPALGEAWRTIMAVKTLRRIFFALPFLSASLLGLGSLLSLFYEEVFNVGAGGRALLFAFDEPFEIAGLLLLAPIAQRVLLRQPGMAMKVLAFAAVGIAAMLAVQALAPTLWIAVPAGYVRAVIGAILTPGIYAVLSLAIPPKVRGLGFTAGALFAALGAPILPIVGAIGDSFGIRYGILAMLPVFLIGAFIIASSGAFVEADIEKVRVSSLAQAEARRSRLAGDPKLLLVRDVDVAYGQTQVLFGVDMHVDEGEIVALLGTNGAGKSTLLAAIAGLVEPKAGAIVFDGNDITMADANATAAAGIVYVPGGKGVFPTLTVEENINLAGWLLRKEPEHLAEATEQVLEYFPILRKRWNQKAGNLSGGEQQMLTLGQAFIAKPKLLMIDELSLGLAPVIVEQLLEIVKAIHAQGTTIVLVEQSVNVAMSIAKRAVFMEKGEVRFDGPTDQLLARPDVLRAVFLQGTQAASITGRDGSASDERPRRAKSEPIRATFTPHCDHCGTTHRLALETIDLTVQFGGIRAVNGVDISVHEGQILGLIGPNGAGKTTIFDGISGFVPASGKVVIHGADVSDLSPDARAVAGLGRSFQDARLFPSMTVREAIAVALERHVPTRDPIAAAVMSPATRMSERKVRAEVDRLIELMHLEAFADKFVGELSTGSRRVVDIACSMAHDPKVLLLDEPSSGIAQRETEALGPLLLDLRQQTGAAMIVVEHDMPLITAISDELVALELGTVIARGNPDEVVNHPRVVESYLGGNDAVIHRSGSARDVDRRNERRRRRAAARAEVTR